METQTTLPGLNEARSGEARSLELDSSEVSLVGLALKEYRKVLVRLCDGSEDETFRDLVERVGALSERVEQL